MRGRYDKYNGNGEDVISLHCLFEQTDINPQLCYADLEEFIKRVGTKNIYWSPKIDGVRTWAIINNAGVRYFTRNGKEIFNFHIFDEALINLAGNRKPITFDCETSSKFKNVRDVMTQLRRLNNVDPSRLELYIFDIATPKKTFTQRLELLKNLFRNKRFKNVFHLEYKSFKYDPNKLSKLKDEMIAKGHEGVMLQYGDAHYSFGKRTRYCVKVKKVEGFVLIFGN